VCHHVEYYSGTGRNGNSFFWNVVEKQHGTLECIG